MKKCLFFASAILVILSSCVYKEDGEGMSAEVKYCYINNSNYLVKIAVTKTSVIWANVLDSLIPVGDTIQYWDYTFRDEVTGPFGIPEEKTSVTIIFYGANNTDNRCLEFSEPSLSSGDIRSISYYFHLGERREKKQNVYYLITDDHFNDASPCSLSSD